MKLPAASYRVFRRRRIKAIREREGIRISQLAELAEKKIPKGRLIEIENGKEKIVISIE